MAELYHSLLVFFTRKNIDAVKERLLRNGDLEVVLQLLLRRTAVVWAADDLCLY